MKKSSSVITTDLHCSDCPGHFQTCEDCCGGDLKLNESFNVEPCVEDGFTTIQENLLDGLKTSKKHIPVFNFVTS